MKSVIGYKRSLGWVVALAWFMVGSASALPVLSLSQTQFGGVVAVSVTATGATNLYGYQFSLNFDPSVLHATSVTEGPFLATGGATFFSPGTTDNTAGEVSFVFDTLLSAVNGVTGSGVLAVLDFNVLHSLTQTSLSLSDVLAVDSLGNVLPATATGLQFGIPEPSMLPLLLIGLLAMIFVMLREYRSGRIRLSF